MDDAPFEIEASHVGQDHVDVLALAQNVPQHRRDGAGREDAGGHLIEQRLEQVVVPPVDERDVDVGRGEQAGRGQAAEPATDDDNAVPLRWAHDGSFPRGRWLCPQSTRWQPSVSESGQSLRQVLADPDGIRHGREGRAGFTAPMLGKKPGFPFSK